MFEFWKVLSLIEADAATPSYPRSQEDFLCDAEVKLKNHSEIEDGLEIIDGIPEAAATRSGVEASKVGKLPTPDASRGGHKNCDLEIIAAVYISIKM